MAYVQASDFSIILPNADSALLDVAINAVAAMIDNACRRTFSTTIATKTFAVDDPLLIPDFLPNASVVTVTLDGVEISESVYSNGLPSDGYEWLPTNGTPKTALKLHNVTGSHLAITGTWGYGITVPDDIKAAAIVLTRIAYNILRARGKKNERTANYSVTYADVEAVFPAHDLIERLCGAYRRVEV